MRFLLAAALALGTTAVQADEVWTSIMGDIVYEADMGNDAVLSFTYFDAYPAVLIIPGLAGNYQNRSTHEAVWIGTDAGGDCDFMLSYGDYSGTTWGRALVSFDEPAFPTSMTIVMGSCFGPLNDSMRGTTTAQ